MTSILHPPDENFRKTLWDILENVLYLVGVIVVELVRKYVFSGDIPFMVVFILTTGDVIFITRLVFRLAEYWRSLTRRIREWRSDRAVQSSSDEESEGDG